MTTERLAEIKALRAGITPAPWVADMTSGALWHAASGGEIATINWDHQTGDHQPGGDLEFIADAPLMVDDLLAEVERLREQLAKVTRSSDLLDYLSDWVDGIDVLFRISQNPETWKREDSDRVVVDVRHWYNDRIDIHDTAESALARCRKENGDEK